MAYVTAPKRDSGSWRLFFSTVLPEQLQIFCAWQEKSPLNQTGSDHMQFIPLLLYVYRWNIEVSYYEQKTFWSLCIYMVRSRKGIEMLVNLINIAYCAMKILPYQDGAFSKYRTESVQEFRFALSGQIREQVFYAIFVENIETHIKSNTIFSSSSASKLFPSRSVSIVCFILGTPVCIKEFTSPFDIVSFLI